MAVVRFNELPELSDTSYFTGKNVNEYVYTPLALEKGIIPDAEIAAKIAFDYVLAVYGEKIARLEQPYNIELINNQVWRITGTMPPNALGGVFTLTIEKQTGKIWSICHTK